MRNDSIFRVALLAGVSTVVSLIPVACTPSQSDGGDSATADATILDSGAFDATLDGTTDHGAVDQGSADQGLTDTAQDDTTIVDQPIRNVFVILLENRNWSQIRGSRSAPYINNTLVPMGAHTENYRNPTSLHPSEPNYIWIEAGDNLGITTDADPDVNHQSTREHLVSQLVQRGVSWRVYAEDISGTDCPLTSHGLYVTKHVPQLYFDDVTDTNSATSRNCREHVRPISELDSDLSANTTARYNFIVPNLCNDMHGQILGTQCQLLFSDLIRRGDDWLSRRVPNILASQPFRDRGVLFVMFDEGSNSLSDGPIPFIAIGHHVRQGYASSVAYDHSSYLRTVETIFGVPFLRNAARATDMSDLFTAFP